MSKLKIYPTKISGEVKIPPSKSIAHRSIICASLSDGISIIENIDYSDDIIATISGMQSLGAIIKKKEGFLEIEGMFSNNISKAYDLKVIDCNESGSTLRFLVPISLSRFSKTKFIGKGNLGKRPLDIYYNIFENQNINYKYEIDNLNLEVDGVLKGSNFSIPGNISSQFISGLLFALPLLDDDSKIVITTNLESKGYIDLTLKCLEDFGIKIINKNYKEFIIKGRQIYKARNYYIEGDYSQASFFLCANALGNDVTLKGVSSTSLQGDKVVLDILEKMGAKFKVSENNIKIDNVKNLSSTIIDGSQCPDIIPVIAMTACLANGITKIINAGRLRIKECDRLKAVASEVSKLGVNIIEEKDGLIIEGVEEFSGGVEVWSFDDHRIAMSLAIASTRCKKPIIIKDFECVSKSYPNFFEDFKALGGNFSEWSLGK